MAILHMIVDRYVVDEQKESLLIISRETLVKEKSVEHIKFFKYLEIGYQLMMTKSSENIQFFSNRIDLSVRDKYISQRFPI